jgi:hypothetical protein
MRHEVTIISDDFRVEAGKKLTLVGIYDQAILFPQLPSRLLKLAFFQRWQEATGIEKVIVEIRGSALGDLFSLRAEGRATERPPEDGSPRPARISLVFGPIDFLRPGRIEFRTFFNDEIEPKHTHELDIRADSSIKPFDV